MLIDGLPPDAAVWRVDRLPPAEEMLAVLVERHDAWARAQITHASGKRVQVPAPIRIERPGAPGRAPERPKIETDPRAISAWFAKHIGG